MTKVGERPKLVVIVGPTAVGKTDLSIKLALHLGTEIISADSRQIFRELNIGTAKPDAAQLETVRHHFINSHTIEDSFDAARYGDEALKCIADIFQQRPYAVMCGGSGLYINAALNGFDNIPDIDPGIRLALNDLFANGGIGALHARMNELGFEDFEGIDIKNPHRLIRALEVRIGTGKPISFFHGMAKREHDFDIVKIGLELPREQLYHRIDLRMEKMLEDGLIDEARKLYGYREKQALQTVGYQELFDFFDGKHDMAEAVRLLKRNSRHYAKRQLTWFKRDHEIRWFHPSDFDNIVAAILNQ